VLSAGGRLPTRYSCDGAGDSPPFELERVPDPASALAVTATADGGPLSDTVFWSLWNVPPERERVPAGLLRRATVASLDGARQGRRDGGPVGYVPPCIPPGTTVTLRFQVYALGEAVPLSGGVENDEAATAIQGRTIASDRFTIEYVAATAEATDR